MLDAIAANDGEASLRTIAAATDLPTATAHRLLQTLSSTGHVERARRGRYTLGSRLTLLGDTARRHLADRAEPALARLVNATGETANLALLDRDSIVYLAQVSSQHAMRTFTEVGSRVSVHCTGVGKAILAQHDEREVVRLLQRTGMPARTTRTITSPQAFCRELERVRHAGYALDDGEQEFAVRCIAVPVPNYPLYAISISGPTSRITDDLVKAAVPELLRTAEGFAAF